MIISHAAARDAIMKVIADFAPKDATQTDSKFSNMFTIRLKRGWGCEVSLDVRLDRVIGKPQKINSGGGYTKELFELFELEMETSCSSCGRNISDTISLARSLDELVVIMAMINTTLRGYTIANMVEG